MRKRWKDITLFQFQQIEEINRNENMSDIDKSLFATCIVFGLTEYELDHMPIRKATRLLNQVAAIFKDTTEPKPFNKIGDYEIDYDPAKLTFGQFITLAFYSMNPIRNAHHIFATLADPDDAFQSERVEAFLKQQVIKIIGSLKLFLDKFKAFNLQYKELFGVGTENAQEIQADPFQRQFGWIYSATRVADHNRFTLDEAFKLPVRVAFNDLAYLKAKDKFDEQQYKKK